MTEESFKAGQVIPLVFDLDGTLFETQSSFLPAVKSFLTQYDLDQIDAATLLKMIGEPPSVFTDWLKSLDTEVPLSELTIEFHRHELKSIRNLGKLYPGTSEVLRELHLKGHKLFILSNGSREYVDTVLNRFNLNQYLSGIYVPQSKADTKTAMLQRLCEENHIQYGLMIGDRYHDMAAAKAVNFKAVGTAYGYGGNEMDNADIVINALDELLELIK